MRSDSKQSTGHGELARERMHLGFDFSEARILLGYREESLQRFSCRSLNVEANLNHAMHERDHDAEVVGVETTTRHGWRAEADSAGVERRSIACNGVLVERDVNQIAKLLHFGARQAGRTQVPQYKMVVGATRDEPVAELDELIGHGGSVCTDLLGIGAEFGRVRLLQCNAERGDRIVVRSALNARKHCLANARLEIEPFTATVEDHSLARTTQRLVRRRGHDVRIFKRRRVLASGNEARDVRHVAHEQAANAVGDGAKAREVPVARIRGRAANQHFGAEELREFLQFVVVQIASIRVNAVRQRLEKHGGGGDLLFGGVEAVREMAT
mmetsp:Transcript_12048/g.32438  ORF Transcript_12048/g.32438 Transcript_12048/m.32438 type:complete len:327 (-) Transcript_12048:476-1456(-)